jgi:hypothetical protein
MLELAANPWLNRPLRMRPLIVIHWIILTFLGSLTLKVGAQASASSSATFTVATIKPSDPNRTGAVGDIGFTPSGSFKAQSYSLKELIEFVQDLGYFDVDQRIVGGPEVARLS